jgi:hypothetical protein
VLLEKLFAHLAKVAGGGAVDDDGLHSWDSIPPSCYPQKLPLLIKRSPQNKGALGYFFVARLFSVRIKNLLDKIAS